MVRTVMRMLLAAACALALVGCGGYGRPTVGAEAADYQAVGGLQLADGYLLADVYAFAYRYANAVANGYADADALRQVVECAGASGDGDAAAGAVGGSVD